MSTRSPETVEAEHYLAGVKTVLTSPDWKVFRDYLTMRLRLSVVQGMKAAIPEEAMASVVEQRTLYSIIEMFESEAKMLEQAIDLMAMENDAKVREQITQTVRARQARPYHDSNDSMYDGRMGAVTGGL